MRNRKNLPCFKPAGSHPPDSGTPLGSKNTFRIRLFRFTYLFIVVCFTYLQSEAISDRDSCVAVIGETSSVCLPWIVGANSSNGIYFSDSAVLHGKTGIRIANGDTGQSNWQCRLAFSNDEWTRFYLRLDSARSWIPEQPKSEALIQRTVAAANMLFREIGEDLNLGISFTLDYAYSSRDYRCSFLFWDGNRLQDSISWPICFGELYCIELHKQLKGGRFSAEFFVNGMAAGQWSLMVPESLKWQTMTLFSNRSFPALLSLDDFTFSPKREGAIPPGIETDVPEFIAPDSVLLRCTPFHLNFSGEAITHVRFRLFKNGERTFPIFDRIEHNPGFFLKQNVPFRLDNGSYVFQVCGRNNFGTWGDWSQPKSFQVSASEQKKMAITGMRISHAGSGDSVSFLKRDEWYELTLFVESEMAWDSVTMYGLIWFNDTGYTFGNPSNKGGRFYPSSSYVLNVTRKNGAETILEKRDTNLTKSSIVSSGSEGLYAAYSLNIKDSRPSLKLRFRLLQEARQGKWNVSAILVYVDGFDKNRDLSEDRSLIFHNTFYVNEARVRSYPGSFRIYMIIAGIVFCLVLGYWVWKRNRKMMDSAASTTSHLDNKKYQLIMEYVSSHFMEKILVHDLLMSIRISRRDFHRIMTDNHTSFPQLVNQVRVAEAKKLLINEPAKSVSEIGLIIGLEPNRFFKLFKELEGITPKEFRESQILKT